MKRVLVFRPCFVFFRLKYVQVVNDLEKIQHLCHLLCKVKIVMAFNLQLCIWVILVKAYNHIGYYFTYRIHPHKNVSTLVNTWHYFGAPYVIPQSSINNSASSEIKSPRTPWRLSVWTKLVLMIWIMGIGVFIPGIMQQLYTRKIGLTALYKLSQN